ncbi:MAG: ABC transporter ATP-binding protein [Actinobacteria bacterium]|nr:ABC transporter ATP-binding protein [Actinomycetota bacterium]
MTGSPGVQTRRLRRAFAGRDVIRDLDFVASRGERLALAGPNGAGKTTILRCILGTLTPDDGTITVGGHAAGTIKARRLVGSSLAHDRSLYLRLTGRQNLLLAARLRGLSSDDAAVMAVSALTDELSISEFVDARADRLSTGQQQRVAFARALLAAPSVLLLDEPTRSLDDAGREAFWTAIDRRPEVTVIMATHLEDDLHRCTSVLRLPGGRLV